jgi:pimeloyl-ACP methyl ester carboxylesterase
MTPQAPDLRPAWRQLVARGTHGCESDRPHRQASLCRYRRCESFLSRSWTARQPGGAASPREPGTHHGLVIQNGDIYRDVLGPKYASLLEYFDYPTAERRASLEKAVSEEGFREEFLNSVRPQLAERIPPDLWILAAAQLLDPRRRKICVALMEGLKENLEWFPRYQAYLREHRPPALIVWGPQDGYMPEPSAHAYLRDLPKAKLHLLDAGHWALETNLDEIVALIRDFLEQTHGK